MTNGGLSLIHEAIYLQKPILSVPVRHQFEQEMNARYLEDTATDSRRRRSTPTCSRRSCAESHKYEKALKRHHQKGNEVLFKKVDRLIEELT